ncbi:MAG: hypothetical protein WEC75_00110 [Dehalococcoidia bacterium]
MAPALGASDEEVREPLPGDEYVSEPQVTSTRAVTIDAPVSEVWPWLVQIGQNRAGFYSYAWLENILGTHMTNAGRIVPEWQQLAAGDKVWLHPRVALTVLEVERERSIVLAEDWAFVLRPIGPDRTRFIVRGRGRFTFPDLKLPPLNFIYWRLLFEPGHFIMEQGMMRGIKRRAERLAAERRVAEALA